MTRDPTGVTPPGPERELQRASQSALTLAAVAGVIVAITAVLIALLVTGGEGGGQEDEGDVSLVKGKQPRDAAASIAAAVADISEASVAEEDSRVVFEVTTAAPIPDEFTRSSLEFRFDISEGGRKTWILSANVNISPTAALVSQASDYSATTIDGSLPGELEIAGRKLTISFDRSAIESFPQSFEWALTSNLIAFRDLTGSTRAEDRFPDAGFVSF